MTGATGVAEHKFTNDDGSSFTIHGQLIGHGDTKGDGKDRWVAIDIYRVEPEGYATHRAGESRLYHRKGNASCVRRRSGTPMGSLATREALPGDAVSCDICQPVYLQDLRPGEEVLFEYARHSVKWFPTAPDLLADLYGMRGYSGSEGQHASRPARAALAAARENDGEFAKLSLDVEIGKGKTE